jgi:hypothetical protein
MIMGWVRSIVDLEEAEEKKAMGDTLELYRK